MVLRNRDTTANGTLDERMYYCQNWRADVSAIVDDAGEMYEWVKYSAYGVPFGLPGADTDSDGDCDATDINQIRAWILASAYDARGDVDLDGDVDSSDRSIAMSRLQGGTLGRENQSLIGVRAGYAGYERAQQIGAWHVRNRVIVTGTGHWSQRDPFKEGFPGSMYAYGVGSPISGVDPLGLFTLAPDGLGGFFDPYFVEPCPADDSVDQPSAFCVEAEWRINVAYVATPADGQCVNGFGSAQCTLGGGFEAQIQVFDTETGEWRRVKPRTDPSIWCRLWHGDSRCRGQAGPTWETAGGNVAPPLSNGSSAPRSSFDLSADCGGYDTMTVTATSAIGGCTMSATVILTCGGC